MLFTSLAKRKILLALAVVQVCDAFTQAFRARSDGLLLIEKCCLVDWRGLVNARKQGAVAIGLLLTLGFFVLQAANIGGQFLQPVAAVLAQVALQLRDLRSLGFALGPQTFELDIKPGGVLFKQLQPPIQQLYLESCEIRVQCVSPVAPALDFRDQGTVATPVLDQGCQQLNLSFGLEHRLMGAVQVVKVADQGLDAAAHIKRLQHVAAHEVGEVAHRFHRNRLVKQLQCLLVLNTETTTEPGAVWREAVEELTARGAQFLAQGGDVAAEVGEILSNAHRALGRHEQASGLALRVLQPEHLGQGHRLVIALVAEDAQDDRIA